MFVLVLQAGPWVRLLSFLDLLCDVLGLLFIPELLTSITLWFFGCDSNYFSLPMSSQFISPSAFFCLLLFVFFLLAQLFVECFCRVLLHVCRSLTE